MSTEVQTLSSDINVITAEINAYKRIAGEAIFEIGRRLKHVKEAKLAERHGGWTNWLREIELSTSHADRFEKVFTELADGKFPPAGSIALGRLYEIATLPPDERERPHTVPSTGETKRPDEMTVRELREVKAALKEAEKAREEVADENEVLRGTVESLAAAPPRIEYIKDETLEARLRRYEERFGDIGVHESSSLRIASEVEVEGLTLGFSEDVRDFLKKYGFLRNYQAEFGALNQFCRAEYVRSADAMSEFMMAIRDLADKRVRGRPYVIDAI
ncbi:DUF3102 domain-containing protein [Mycobacterium gordonae]|nr:DUF3102 domain-containing protein [Mycobacterium gordonae]